MPPNNRAAIGRLIRVFELGEMAIQRDLLRARGEFRRAQLRSIERDIDNTLRRLRKRSGVWAQKEIPQVYSRSVLIVEKQFPKIDVIGSFGLLHEQAANNLADGLANDLAKMTDNISKEAKRQLRNLATQELAGQIIGGQAIDKAARSLAKEMEERGIRFVDRAGRGWKPHKWAAMAARTQSGLAFNMGTINASASLDLRGVRVLDGVDDDPECTSANGQRWSFAFAQAHPLQHPNCERTFTPIPPSDKASLDRGDSDIVQSDTFWTRAIA